MCRGFGGTCFWRLLGHVVCLLQTRPASRTLLIGLVRAVGDRSGTWPILPFMYRDSGATGKYLPSRPQLLSVRRVYLDLVLPGFSVRAQLVYLVARRRQLFLEFEIALRHPNQLGLTIG